MELLPIVNAPHQCGSTFINLREVKLALTYRYLFQRNALRIVTHSNDEYLLKFRSHKHKDKVLKLLLKYATLDPFYQQLESPNEVYKSEKA